MHENTKSLNPFRTNAPAPARRVTRFMYSLGLALLGLLAFVVPALAADGGGAETSTAKVKIDLASPASIVLKREFDGQADTVEIPLGITNGQDHAFVTFDALPAGVSLFIKQAWNGYSAGEQIAPGKWYWFRPQAPLMLTIKSSAASPVMLTFWAAALSEKQKADAAAAPPDKMREFTDSAHFAKQGDPFTLVFNRKGEPTPDPTPIGLPDSDPPFVAFFTNHLLRTLLISVGLLALLALILVFGPELKDYLVDRIKNGKQKSMGRGKSRRAFTTNSGGMYDFDGKTSPPILPMSKTNEVGFARPAANPSSRPSPPESVSNPQTIDSLNRDLKALVQTAEQRIGELKVTESFQRELRTLEQRTERDFKQLRKDLADSGDLRTQVALKSRISDLEHRLSALERKLDQRLTAEVQALKILTAETSFIDPRSEEISRPASKLVNDDTKAKKPGGK